MIRIKTLAVVAQMPDPLEQLLEAAFNEWVAAVGAIEILKIFEPHRRSETYGDSGYNEHRPRLTLVYEDGQFAP